MEQMNFFEAFGLGEDDFFGTTKRSVGKKEEKKVSAKNAGKEKKVPAKAEDFEVKLPVNIKARAFEINALTIGEATVAKVSDIWKELEKRYPQFAMGALELVYIKEVDCLFVCDGRLSATGEDASVFADAESTIKVCDGGTACELSASDFTDEEPDEVTLGEIRDRFVEANPLYDGCGLYFDEKAQCAYPVFDKIVAPKAGELTEVTVCGERKTFELDTNETLAVKAGGNARGIIPYVVSGKAGGIAWLSWRKAAGKGVSAYSPYGSGTIETPKAKNVEKKYPLPMSLLVANFNQTYELTSDMFEGKEKVTKEDITKAMAKVDSLFGDSERKIEYLFNESRKVMSCMFVSGKKGIMA